MKTQPEANNLERIEDLENRLAEAEQLIDAIKTGEVDAFAIRSENKTEIFTLHSGDYAYRVLVENFSEGAINITEEGLIVYSNKYFHELLDLSYEKVIGTSVFDFIHPQSIETFKPLFTKAFGGQSKGEINLVAATNIIPVYISLTSLYPQLPTIGIIVTDLTEKKKNEKILEDKNKELERTILKLSDMEARNASKDEFISIASHEMKTPLTTAKGYIELLLRSLSEENQTALYATKANQALERLHDSITELLDVSKIQNGQLNYNITGFDFNELLDETMENVQHTTKNHILHKTGNISQQINGDKGRLQQVLINLLSNAIKYSPNADKVLVKIEEQDSKVQVSVQDFGIGMSKQHLDKIFDRYYRVEEHAVHFQGLGIGLYISNNIIKRHEGKMWAESEPEQGSTFYFTLPV